MRVWSIKESVGFKNTRPLPILNNQSNRNNQSNTNNRNNNTTLFLYTFIIKLVYLLFNSNLNFQFGQFNSFQCLSVSSPLIVSPLRHSNETKNLWKCEFWSWTYISRMDRFLIFRVFQMKQNRTVRGILWFNWV